MYPCRFLASMKIIKGGRVTLFQMGHILAQGPSEDTESETYKAFHFLGGGARTLKRGSVNPKPTSKLSGE